MFLQFKNKIVLLTIFYLLGIVALFSCNQKKTDYLETTTEDKVLVPKVKVSVETPKSIVYVNNSIQSSFSSVPFLNKALKSLTDSSTSLYTAMGDGGLGANLDDNNNLIPFPGIKITTDFLLVDKSTQTLSITPSGDKECYNIFILDKKNSMINIDSSQVDHLISCTIKVSASAISTDSKNPLSVSDKEIIGITLNPTLAMYAQQNDPVFKYLQAYSSIKDVELIAKWLKDSAVQSAGLKLKYDPVVIKDGTLLQNVNALTGAQSITSIDLSNTSLKDLKALLYFENLQKINLSGTKFEPQNLPLLGKLKTLNSLNVSNTNIKDIKVITNNIKTLTELDVSGNTDISDLEDIANLGNLKKLTASSIGLTSLKRLNGITQLTSLDLSNNDLSKITQDDVQILVNLYNLQELNISKSHIPDAFLNSYFDAVASRKTLKKFVDANAYQQSASFIEEECSYNVNNFSNIYKISTVSSLEYIDIHGNSCNVGFAQRGMQDTNYFSVDKMPHLKYLDISNTVVTDLQGLARSSLTELHIFHHPIDDKGNVLDEGGIPMTKMACIQQLGEHNPINSECDLLGGGSQKSQDWGSPGSYTFTVPTNVYSISVIGCSGGDGGQGGSGGQGGYAGVIYNETGGGWITYAPDVECRACGGPSYFINTSIPGPGGNGYQGGISSVSGILTTDHTPYYQDYNGHCGAGAGGNGGASGGIATGYWGTPKPPEPINGYQGSPGVSKKVYTVNNVAVTPGQVLNVVVGAGGAGGTGSGPAQNGGCAYADAWHSNGGGYDVYCAGNGEVGGTGGAGTPGYVKIMWNQ